MHVDVVTFATSSKSRRLTLSRSQMATEGARNQKIRSSVKTWSRRGSRHQYWLVLLVQCKYSTSIYIA